MLIAGQVSGSAASMQEGVRKGEYIDFWQVDDRYHVIRTKAVTDICDKVGGRAGSSCSQRAYS